MKHIIGVTHFAEKTVSSGFYTSSHGIVPRVSQELQSFISGARVGLETLAESDKLDILEQFFFPEGPSGSENRYFFLYRPDSQEYFYTLKKQCSGVDLDSKSAHERLLAIEHAYKNTLFNLESEISRCTPMHEEHFHMFFEKPDSHHIIEDATSIGIGDFEDAYEAYEYHYSKVMRNAKIDTDFFIQLFLLKREAHTIEKIDRTKHLLDRIQNTALDVAVIGLGHAVYLQEQGYDFTYWMEDTMNGITLQPLDPSLVIQEKKYMENNTQTTKFHGNKTLAKLLWENTFEENRQENSVVYGLLGDYSPDRFFEVQNINGKPYIFSQVGITEVNVNQTDDAIAIVIPETNETIQATKYDDGLYRRDGYDGYKSAILSTGSESPLDFMRSVYAHEPGVIANNLRHFKIPKVGRSEVLIPKELSHLLLRPDYPSDKTTTVHDPDLPF